MSIPPTVQPYSPAHQEVTGELTQNQETIALANGIELG